MNPAKITKLKKLSKLEKMTKLEKITTMLIANLETNLCKRDLKESYQNTYT